MGSGEEVSDQGNGAQRQASEAGTPASRPLWLYLWLMSSLGLGVGVLGTATYITWFGGDLAAYEQAIQAARGQPVTVSESGGKRSWAVGRVIHAVPAEAAAPASATPADTASGAQPQRLGDAALPAANVSGAACSASAAPDANVTATPHATPAANAGSRHGAVGKPKPPTLIARIGSAFRRVSYRHHGSGHDQTIYDHP